MVNVFWKELCLSIVSLLPLNHTFAQSIFSASGNMVDAGSAWPVIQYSLFSELEKQRSLCHQAKETLDSMSLPEEDDSQINRRLSILLESIDALSEQIEIEQGLPEAIINNLIKNLISVSRAIKEAFDYLQK